MKADFFTLGDSVRGSSFSFEGGANEYYFTIDTTEAATFEHELEHLYELYTATLESYGLSDATQIFIRFYVSDIANQKASLHQSKIFELAQAGAVSIIQQCPIKNGNISIIAKHIQNNGSPFEKQTYSYDKENWRNGLLLKGKHYNMLWTASFAGCGSFDSYVQTEELFLSWKGIMDSHKMNLLDNAVRTWIFVRDVDNHYSGMVRARREFFEREGLTPDSRYIASTGIEGISKEIDSLVAMSTLSIKNLKPEQIVRMEALDNLSPTIKYGVTFERGTRIRFGDRSHLYISGTASIDKHGKVMHNGDPVKQTKRTIENIRALLKPHGADISDMAYIIAYLRNFKDQDKVLAVMNDEIPPEIPRVFLVGAVCRPSWLVELEGVAIIPDSTEFAPFF